MRKTPEPHIPYKTLGLSLKRLRTKYRHSLSEVCGAVEIDEEMLGKIEAGQVRPAEELLEQLINHYQPDDEDALNIWELAGYDTEDLEVEDTDPLIGQNLSSHIIMLTSMEQKTAYSDSLDIHYNDSGLILNFKQSVEQSKSISVSKVGMSYEQAERVYETLQKVLLRHKYLKGPKGLPSGDR